MIDFLDIVGIRHEATAGYYSPQSNGVSEQLNRTLLEVARAMLHENGIPTSLWGEAVACWIRNRLPTRALESDTTPYEVWEGRKPVGIRYFM
jgi:hypothetical protein